MIVMRRRFAAVVWKPRKNHRQIKALLFSACVLGLALWATSTAQTRTENKGAFCMSTSKLQRYVSRQLSIHIGGYTIRENIRPEWLIADDGARLELDFYIEELSAAIEVQGAQHYTFVEKFHGDYAGFQKRIKYDCAKRKTCIERGIKLYEVSNQREADEAVDNICLSVPVCEFRIDTIENTLSDSAIKKRRAEKEIRMLAKMIRNRKSEEKTIVRRIDAIKMLAEQNGIDLSRMKL